jgi:hypothetical protein
MMLEDEKLRDLAPQVSAAYQSARRKFENTNADRRAITAAFSSDRAYTEELVTDLISAAGPSVDDALILRAAELSKSERLTPAEALDRVLVDGDQAADAATGTSVAPERIDVNDMRGGLDDPGRPIEDTFFTDEDLADLPDDFDIPFFDDGRSVTPEGVKEELERLDWLSTVVGACRI